MKRSLRERLRMRKRPLAVIVPNTFIGGIAKLGGTGNNAPILTAAQLASRLGTLSIKGFRVVGENVECLIDSFPQNDHAAFMNNTNITYFRGEVFASELKYNAFNSCTSLVSVDLPMVDNVAYDAFRNCTSLVTVNLKAATRVRTSAFNGCISLPSISLPSVTYIANLAFSGCSELSFIDAKKCVGLGDNFGNNNVFRNIKLNATINVNIFLKTVNAGEIDGDLLYAYNSRSATINFYDDDGNFVETYQPIEHNYVRMSSIGYVTFEEAEASFDEVIRFYDGTENPPEIGTVIYNDSNYTSLLYGGDLYFLMKSQDDRLYVSQINDDGEVMSVVEIFNTNIYTLNDALQPQPFETETIDDGWTFYEPNEIEIEIVDGNNSEWAMRAIKTGTGQSPYGGNVFITLNNLEVGETYRVTADVRSLNDSQDEAGRGFMRTRSEAGWQSQGYFDIENYAWETKSFTCRPAATSADILLFPSWFDGGIGSIQGNSCVVDNIVIEKIS